MPTRSLVLCTDPGVPLYGPSGASAHLRGVTAALHDLGHDVIVAVSRAVDQRGAVDDPVHAPVIELGAPTAPRRWLRELQESRIGRDLHRRLGPIDLIWERHSLFGTAGRVLAHRRGIPRILEVNAPLHLERQPRRHRRLGQWLQHRSIRTADRVIAVSSWLADWCRGQGGDARTVFNGTRPQRPGDRAGTRSRLGLDGLVIGFAGSGRSWQGLHRIPGILDALPEATAVVAGPVAPDHPRVVHLGAVLPSELPDVVSAFDVGLVPWAGEPPWLGPLKLWDYLAQGVPVVALPAGDLPDQLGRHGALVEDTPSSWAAGIRQAIRLERQPRLRTWTDVVHEALR